MIHRQFVIAALAIASFGAVTSTASAEWWGQFAVQDPALTPGVPDVAITHEQNTTVVVWPESDGSNMRIRAARFAINSTTPIDIGYVSDAGSNASLPRIAINDQATAMIVWHNDTTNTIDGATVSENATSSTSLGALSATGASEASINSNRSSNFVAVWTLSPGVGSVVQAVRLDATGPLGSVETLTSGPALATHPQAIVEADGQATVVWQLASGGSDVIQAVGLPLFGPPAGPTIDVSTPGTIPTPATVSGESGGSIVAAWTQIDGGDTRVMAAYISNGGSSSTLLPAISDVGANTGTPRVAQSRDGNIAVVWRQDGLINNSIYASVFQSGQAPSTPIQLSDGSANYALPAVVSANDGGGATFTWEASFGVNNQAIESKYLPRGSHTPSSVSTLSSQGPAHLARTPATVIGDDDGLVFTTWQTDLPNPAIFANRTYAQVAVSPSNIDFGSVQVGSTATRNVTITNPDPISPVRLQQPEITPAGTFTWDIVSCDGGFLPGQSCVLSVTFAPTAPGQATATMAYPSNARTPVPDTSLSGNGVITPPPTPTPTPTPDPPKPCVKITTRSAKPARIKPTDHTGAWAAGIRLVAETSGPAKLKIQATGTVNVSDRQRKITFATVNNMTVSKQRRYGLFPTSSTRRYAQLGKRVRLTLKTTVTPLQTGCTASAAATQALTSTIRKIVTDR